MAMQRSAVAAALLPSPRPGACCQWVCWPPSSSSQSSLAAPSAVAKVSALLPPVLLLLALSADLHSLPSTPLPTTAAGIADQLLLLLLLRSTGVRVRDICGAMEEESAGGVH